MLTGQSPLCCLCLALLRSQDLRAGFRVRSVDALPWPVILSSILLCSTWSELEEAAALDREMLLCVSGSQFHSGTNWGGLNSNLLQSGP